MIEFLRNVFSILTGTWWGGLLLTFAGILIVRSAMKMKESPDLVSKMRGYAGGVGLVIVGVMVVCYQIFKLFKSIID